jgi:acyl-CoA synthetase (AMP-forming)/AMP-acid ligase II
MSTPTVALRDTIVAVGNRVVVTDLRGERRSGAELVDNVDRLAGAIKQAAPPRPKVGLWYRNSAAAVEAFLAVEWLGGTRLPVDPVATEAEARAVFAAAKADIVLCDAAHAVLLGDLAVVHDNAHPFAAKPQEPIDDLDLNFPFMIYPRAVTDGQLFGVPLSYGNWHAIIDGNVSLYRSGRYGIWDEATEVFLSAQQIMHGTGFLGTFPFLAMGLPQIIVHEFDVTTVLEVIDRYAVTGTMFVPAMLQSFLDKSDQGPFQASSLRHLLYGGGPLTGEQIQRAAEHFGPALTQVYGRVEGGWPISILDAEAHRAIQTGNSKLLKSCGRPIAEVDTRLRPLPGMPSDHGELQVRCAMSSSDYVDADGWCRLGDVVRRDAQGYLYFERRLDRMINTGYHVYPDEIEAILAAARGVAEASVVGEAHPRWGQSVIAYIVPNGEIARQTLPDLLKERVSQRLAKYKVPREFRIVAQIP